MMCFSPVSKGEPNRAQLSVCFLYGLFVLLLLNLFTYSTKDLFREDRGIFGR